MPSISAYSLCPDALFFSWANGKNTSGPLREGERSSDVVAGPKCPRFPLGSSLPYPGYKEYFAGLSRFYEILRVLQKHSVAGELVECGIVWAGPYS
jgi:hypothetical protein